MKVKKYVAPTMPEAMNKVRKELGTEAVILQSKEIQSGGILGLFKKTNIEVIAALDPPVNQEPVADKWQPQVNEPAEKSGNFGDQRMAADQEIMKEIKNLRKLMEQHSSSLQEYSTSYQEVYRHLIQQEVDQELARSIVEETIETYGEPEGEEDTKQCMRNTLSLIKGKLNSLPFEGITYDEKIIQLVGPTGVGKTTTLAKIAAKCVLEDNKRVAFITTDTYRIAAVEQLKTYARILDIPMEVAYTLEDYQQAIKKFEAYDLILVDTAGRNFRDGRYVSELRAYMEIPVTVHNYLVLSLTAKPKDIMEIMEQFKQIPIKQAIFTKTDETTQYGSMLNTALIHRLGIAYTATGQEVPEDLEKMGSDKLLQYVTGDYFAT
ncbi:flagellar biosynthesis protein FlhF [Virgibacillus sediminis]|uniref:Flagellar biosynthesis protein FlhF n=1 Tax=Virgibacillus sediminis TaxID=202260 RepID=A0ABV7AAD4_9BACI